MGSQEFKLPEIRLSEGLAAEFTSAQCHAWRIGVKQAAEVYQPYIDDVIVIRDGLQSALKNLSSLKGMNMYVYIRSESQLWTVGFYDPSGKWHTDSDHPNPNSAADRVAYLNGTHQD